MDVFDILLLGTRMGSPEQARNIEGARTRAEQARDATERLEGGMDRVALVCRAMWSLLAEKTGATEQELIDRVREVDLSDGRLDGRVRGTPVKCEGCGRTLNARHERCLYCGGPVKRGSAFDGLP